MTKQLHGAEKSHFMVPLGKAFVKNGIIKGACVESLVRNDASKIGILWLTLFLFYHVDLIQISECFLIPTLD